MKHTHKAKGPIFNMAQYEPTEINPMMRGKMLEGATPRGACDQGIVDIGRAKNMKELYKKQGDWVLEKTPFEEILIMDMAAAQPQWFLEKILGLWLALHGKEQYSPKWWIDAGIKVEQKEFSGKPFYVSREDKSVVLRGPFHSVGEAIHAARKRAKAFPGEVVEVKQTLFRIAATVKKLKPPKLPTTHDGLANFLRDNPIRSIDLGHSIFRRGLDPGLPTEMMRDMPRRRITWEGLDRNGNMGRVAEMLNGHEVVGWEVSRMGPSGCTLKLRLRRK